MRRQSIRDGRPLMSVSFVNEPASGGGDTEIVWVLGMCNPIDSVLSSEGVSGANRGRGAEDEDGRARFALELALLEHRELGFHHVGHHFRSAQLAAGRVHPD